jgi:hypothetical protein
VNKAVNQSMIVDKVRREKALDFGGATPARPETGSLHPVAKGATSSFDVLRRGVFS